MTVIKSSYETLRPRLQTGDVVFFGGHDGFFSTLIRWWTRSPYSHVAVVWRTFSDRVMLMESTTLLDGKRGVQATVLSQRIRNYKGIVDIAPLSAAARANFDAAACDRFLEAAEGRPYDGKGAALSGIGQYLRVPGKERGNALFCSELADHAHKYAGLIVGKDRTPTPEEMARRPIYEAFYRVKDLA